MESGGKRDERGGIRDDPHGLEGLGGVLRALSTAREGSPSALAREPSLGLAELSLDAPRDLARTLDELARALVAAQTHTTHARYFGLPNPAPTFASIAGASLAAALSAQLATRRSAPLAVAIERRLVRELGARFGFEGEHGGALTSGGAEASTMAVLAALVRHAPDFARRGARGLARDPVVYVSAEGHPTIAKAVRAAGLGDTALRRVRVDEQNRMRPEALREAVANDRQAGRAPILVVATAGTTTTGAIDDIAALADVAARARAWLHVDAAWGGMLAMTPDARAHVGAIARADSVTFDPHKALFVPTGTGAFLTRECGGESTLYEIESGYLPRDRSGEAHATTPLWSRAFGGLPLFLSLAVHGFPAHEATIQRQLALGERLRAGLVDAGFSLVAVSPLPLACFVDASAKDGASARHLAKLAHGALVGAGAWVALVRLPGGARVLRAAIVGHATREDDVDALIRALVAAR